MTNARLGTKSPAQMPLWEDLAGKTLLDEYAKVEESDSRETGRLQETLTALAIPADVDEWMFPASIRDEMPEETEEVWNESMERPPVARELAEEMSGLEVENDLFEATTKMRRENVAEPQA